MSLKFHQLDHPILKHKLSILRDKKTTALIFRLVMEEMSQLVSYEACRDLIETKKESIDTPLEKTDAEFVVNDLVLVAVMRAGNGMLGGVHRTYPFATVGHIGIYRDKFINSTVEYYLRLPKDIKDKKILLLDPMLATGDTLCAAIDRLKEYQPKTIRCISLLSCKEGIQKVNEIHPDVDIYTVSVERELSSGKYLLPGIGDAGDRLYDTVPL